MARSVVHSNRTWPQWQPPVKVLLVGTLSRLRDGGYISHYSHHQSFGARAWRSLSGINLRANTELPSGNRNHRQAGGIGRGQPMIVVVGPATAIGAGECAGGNAGAQAS